MKGGALMSGGVKACYLEAVLQYTGRLARSNQLKLAVLRRISAQNVDMNLSVGNGKECQKKRSPGAI